MKLEQVVPFGRSLDEYRRMFALTGPDLAGRILGVADGPASFNAEMRALGHHAVSADPLYVFSAAQIALRFDAVVDDIIGQVEATPGDWTWDYHRSPEHLRQNRVRAMAHFARDFETGRGEGRYVAAKLPRLPFSDRAFDLALCSHLLFLYSAHFDYRFHRASVLEMLRVAGEVRIFPLLTLTAKRSPYVEPLLAELAAQGFSCGIERVPYELQRGGNEMLRLRCG